jgi:hypothetical protein
MSTFEFKNSQDWIYALNTVETVAWLAGRPDYLDDLREDFEILFDGSGAARSARIFEWLAAAMTYQGISDAVARGYMEEHGRPRWRTTAHGVKQGRCSLLKSYWHFHGCGYRKSTRRCANPHLIKTCPLPLPIFRKGTLNQLTYSLYLFIRDIAGGDLIAWLDARLAEANVGPVDGRISRMQNAVIKPLAGVHGASHKVLSMALSDLLIIGSTRNPVWGEVGGALIAIDTLVHNFLVRTGILARANASHPYGAQCYGARGCATVLSALCDAIDARQFHSQFPKSFPRYIQHAIWTYCAGEGLGVCNGRTINDRSRCANRECRLYGNCDRLVLAGR